jgi:hypothetical protein
MSKTPQKPGSRAERSGQYEIVGPRGGGTGKERTVTKGEPLPPTPKPGQGYKLVDPSKNGAGKK